MKYLLLITALTVSTASFAQKSMVKDAMRSMNAFSNTSSDDESNQILHLTKAIGAIDEASKNAETKDDVKTIFLKARIYTAALNVSTLGSEERLMEANSTLLKAIKTDAKIQNDKDYPATAINLSLANYNSGINEYNNQNFLVSKDYFGNVRKFIGDAPDKKYTDLFGGIDTVRAECLYYQAKSEMNEANYSEALSLFEKATESPYLDQKSVLTDILFTLDKTGAKEKQLEYIAKARAKYPNDENIQNFEINYYIEEKQYDNLITKLEEQLQKDPNNPKTPFNLGLVYSAKAAPVDGYLPDNASVYEKKAEEYYGKALELAGDNADYNQSLGVHYYNLAINANNKAKYLSENGNEKEKYQAIQFQKVRDSYYKKALPVLEKAAKLYEANSGLDNNGKQNYANTLEAMRKIYATMNDTQKYKQTQEKIDALYK